MLFSKKKVRPIHAGLQQCNLEIAKGEQKQNPKNLHVTNNHVNKTRAWAKESPEGRPQ